MTDSELSVAALYPLRFEPIYKDYIWGGRRFEHLFHRDLPQGAVAESWEIADHPHGESLVVNGPLRGISLHRIVETKRPELLGANHAEHPVETVRRFPLMLKYLDARSTLSIQVHPSTEICTRLGINDFGKTEAWVVVDAEHDSHYYAGFKKKYSREEVAAALADGTLADLMHPVRARVGDCILLEPGPVHALGEGVMVVEVQTTSDITFRLFDWNRCDASGNPRPLHVVESLEAADFQRGPVFPIIPKTGSKPNCEILLHNKDFHLNRWTSESQFMWNGDGRCHLWTILQGTATAIFTAGRRRTPVYESGRENDPDGIEILNRGDSMLVPAMTPSIRWIAEDKQPVVLLDAVIP